MKYEMVMEQLLLFSASVDGQLFYHETEEEVHVYFETPMYTLFAKMQRPSPDDEGFDPYVLWKQENLGRAVRVSRVESKEYLLREL